MIKFFTSIKTTLWLMGISIAVYLTGSFFIPQNLDIFSEINDMPLFAWLSRNSDYGGKTFWIYLLIGLMALLAINTVVCSVDALVKGLKRKGLVEAFSPQVLHAGVLFVLIGHLVSAASGYKEDVPVNTGETVEARGFKLAVENIEFLKLPGEDSTRWRVSAVLDNGRHMLEPAHPVFYKRTGFFAKSAHKRGNKAIIALVYDPGVPWVVLGAALFVIGAGGVFSCNFRGNKV